MEAMRLVAVAGLALALAGCGGAKKDEAKPAAQKSAAPAKGGKKGAPPPPVQVKFQPGRWETTMKMSRLDMGNVPPGVREAIQQAMGKERKFAYCLTPAEADKPNSGFFNRNEGGNCSYDTYDVSGGHIVAKMTCTTPQGKQTVSLSGTYAPDTYAMTMEMSGSRGQGMPMLMTMDLSSRRTGDCTGDEAR